MLRRLLVALALCAAPSLACSGNQNLQKVEGPASGVTLGYDLAAGQIYKGNVRSSETVRATPETLSLRCWRCWVWQHKSSANSRQPFW